MVLGLLTKNSPGGCRLVPYTSQPSYSRCLPRGLCGSQEEPKEVIVLCWDEPSVRTLAVGGTAQPFHLLSGGRQWYECV